MKSKNIDINFGNEIEKENKIPEHNYKNLKDLITIYTKLYMKFREHYLKKLKII